MREEISTDYGVYGVDVCVSEFLSVSGRVQTMDAVKMAHEGFAYSLMTADRNPGRRHDVSCEGLLR